MAPEPVKTIQPPGSASGGPELTITTEKTQLTLNKSAAPKYPNPPAWFTEALEDAERLLKYAAELGIPVDDQVRDRILQARATIDEGWDEETASHVLIALSALSARLKPITAASLKACSVSTRSTVRNYLAVAILLAIVIVPFSIASFLSSAISTTIRADIATANDLAVKLRAELGPPAAMGQPASPKPATATNPDNSEVISQLQQYAAAIRSIDQRARQLNALVLHAEQDPYREIRSNKQKVHDTFQLPSGLADFSQASLERTDVYQYVRYFAQSTLDDVSFFYGAITACVLPVLYALLGTCAYLLRTFEQQMATRTFMPSIANSARFLIAAIGGAVVGLFSNFAIGQGASIPPLAIAFLVGYAVDVFFAFLEGVIQSFTRSSAGAGPSASAPAGKA
jgi:hypothetical protein